MSLTISIDTSNGLSEQDVAIIGAIAGAVGAVAPGATTVVNNIAAEAAKLAEKVEKPAAKKAAAAKPAPAEPAAEPEEDLLGGDDEGLTKEDAVKKATELVAQGKAKDVKAALVEVGVAKVGQLETPELVAAWFAALPA